MNGTVGSGSIFSTVSLSGGTLDMTGHTIGTGTTQISRTLWHANGVLANAPSLDTNQFIVGRDSGTTVFTDNNATTTINIGLPTAEGELYVGYGTTASTNGEYDLAMPSRTIYGWTNIGRDGGVGVVNIPVSTTFNTTEELRIGAEYANVDGSNGTVNNSGSISANVIELGIVSTPGKTSTGALTLQPGSSTTTAGPIQIGLGAGGTGTFTMNGGTVNTLTDWVVTGVNGTGHSFQHGGDIHATIFDVGQNSGSQGDYTMDDTVAASSGVHHFRLVRRRRWRYRNVSAEGWIHKCRHRRLYW